MTPNLNFQAEVRQRSNRRNLWSTFSTEHYSESRRRRADQTTGRLGLQYSPAPHSDFLTSLIYTNLERSIKDNIGGIDYFGPAKQDGIQGEAQYIFSGDIIDIIPGVSVYSFDAHNFIKGFQDGNLVGELVFDRNSTLEHYNYYLYNHILVGNDARFTIGASYDYFKHQKKMWQEFDPKIGLEWSILEGLLFRFAAF